MQSVLIAVHLIIVLALVGVVLLQRSEGGGLGLGGGGGVGGFMTGRGQANVLTRATAILGTAFFITSISLAWVASANRAPRSVIDSVQRPAVPGGAPAPAAPPGGGGPGLLDELRRLQGDQPGGAPPAQPR